MSGYPVGSEPRNWGDWIEPAYRRVVAELWENVFGDDPQAMQSAEWRFMNGRWGESFVCNSEGHADTVVTACVSKSRSCVMLIIQKDH
jgi:hypothetical protein